MEKSAGARALYDTLRALEEKAKTARIRSGERYSRRDVAHRAGGDPKSLGNRLGEWLAEDWGGAKTPDPGSEFQLMAVVRVWSKWADDRFDERRWATLLEEAQASRSAPLPVPERALAFTGYSTWIEQNILPAQLVGRQEELQELTAFCTGSGAPAYVWWQAAAWAGKSALVSEFVLRHQPTAVDIVSYFITDRLGRNDREGFLDAVMRQLAVLAGRGDGAVSVRAEDFPELCRAAAEACRSRDKRLVLMVDGLDEDQGAAAGERSIAALLPRHPPAGMRIVVTGRPRPPIADDVPPDHPLRTPEIIRPLTPYPDAQGISTLARRELHRLLKDDKAGVPLLGLLVAARGGLTAADLAEFVGVRPYEVDTMLRGITGRSFLPASHGRIRLPDIPTGPVSHALGHEELRREALAALGDVTEFEQRLHTWADGYRAQGWPEDTPDYLLYDYPRMLHSAGDLQRLSAIALDPHRQRALMERASLDTAFTHIELTAQMVRRQCPDNVVELTALAASSTVLAERARALPADVPVTFARLGQARRAMDLALVAPFPAEKAVRLARVARVLGEVGHQLATAAASEAARWAERAHQENAPPSGDEQEAEEAIGEAAVALMAMGELRRGHELLGWLGASAGAGDEAGATVVARAACAARSHDAALTEELLDQAERYAEEMAAASPADPSAPVAAWGAIAVAAEGPRADRMYERISQYAQACPPRLTTCTVNASAASVLTTVRPEQANTLAGWAAERLEVALGDPEGLSAEDRGDLNLLLSPMLTAVVRALVDTGSVDRARGLAARVPVERHTGPMGIDTLAGARAVLIDGFDEPEQEPTAQTLARQAYRLADRGEHDAANRRLCQALEVLGSPQGQGTRHSLPREAWLISLCAALSTIDLQDDGAQLARSLRNPVEQVQALAAAAVSASQAGQLEDARHLAYEAADQARRLEGADNFSFLDGAPGREAADAKGAAAQALAHAGERDRALSLAEETGPAESNRRQRALVAVAAGVRSYDPGTAAALIDCQRERLLAPDAHRGWNGRMAELGELFAALSGADAECAGRLHQASEHVAQKLKETDTWLDTEDLLTVLLLHSREEPDEARDTLVRWEERSTGSAPWGLPTGAIAVAHAMLGRLDAARRWASRNNVPSDRAAAFAAVAAYLTQTPSGIRLVSASASTAFTETFRTLALAHFPPASEKANQAALRFTAGALASDGWQHALPALARIAPGAVERVRNIVFTHRHLVQTSG
ncbi:hypothetical protein [Streptomyces sp. 2-1]|uniref:hypothetical protein n=1 Tax=Streptomyces sp. 2-1 TaxID=412710 RepID=UPI003AFA5D55|nr:ATP-binding protein [Streptomyces phaeochromogenes]